MLDFEQAMINALIFLFPRTNNKVEGYNHKLNLYLNTHPNIWKFNIKIKSEETNANLAYTRINNSTYKHRRRNKIDVDRDLQIV